MAKKLKNPFNNLDLNSSAPIKKKKKKISEDQFHLFNGYFNIFAYGLVF